MMRASMSFTAASEAASRRLKNLVNSVMRRSGRMQRLPWSRRDVRRVLELAGAPLGQRGARAEPVAPSGQRGVYVNTGSRVGWIQLLIFTIST